VELERGWWWGEVGWMIGSWGNLVSGFATHFFLKPKLGKEWRRGGGLGGGWAGGCRWRRFGGCR